MKALQVIAVVLTVASAPAAAAEWNTPESRARWSELTRAIYGLDAHLEKATGEVAISAPEMARDAALVPVTLKVAADTPLQELDFVIDQNPSPIAARIHFGPAGDPRQTKLRVRVNAFTNMHAIAVLTNGKRIEDVVYVEGAGGCSAPMGDASDASANMGEMRMKFAATDAFDGARGATLMIRHPNFNGMQMNTSTHALTPARYIKSIVVKRGDASVFELATDISLSSNPVLEFLYRPGVESGKPIIVTVVDTAGQTWTRQFDVPGQG